VYTGYEDGNLEILDFNKNTQSLKLAYRYKAHCDAIKFVCINSTDELLLTASRDGSSRVWKAIY